LKKGGDKYKFATKYTYRNVSRPWISSDSLITDADLGKDDKPFQEMQEFLSSVSPDLKSRMYEATIGKEKLKHQENFVEPQVAKDFSELLGSNIRPFNIPTFLALELGDETGEQGKEVLNKLMTEIGGGQFVELQKAINNKEITAEQVEGLRDNLTDEMEKILGPWAALLIDIPLLSTVEDKFADWVVGDEVESIRKALVDYEIPEDYFENLCEDQ